MSQLFNTHETRVLELVQRIGPRAAHDQLIAENNALILDPSLDHGRAITSARTAIYTVIIGHWAEAQQLAHGYDRPFAVVALGGTGRGEVTPCSDLDIAFLFEDEIEGNTFIVELQRQTINSSEFETEHGFSFSGFPFNFDDVPTLDEKQLNSFLDMRAVHDPTGLTDKMRQRIRDSYDPFQHFLHVRSLWKRQLAQAGDASEQINRFDIKNEGLRIFLGGIWTLAAKDFRHSEEIYSQLHDPRDLAAYEFLLRIRSWIHLRRPPGGQPDPYGNHAEDVLTFEDFTSFGEMLDAGASDQERFEFANEVRARLLSSRRRLRSYSLGIIENELHIGRPVKPGSPIIFGASGLFHHPLPATATPKERSQAALSLLLVAQHYALPVDPSELHGTFRGAGDWLVHVPELGALFQEAKGSIADSFEFLSHIDGAMESLFPGYSRFETSLDERVMTERERMRGALERDKMRALERFIHDGHERKSTAISPTSLAADQEEAKVALVATLLEADHLAAVKLALKTKRLPMTLSDVAARDDASLPWPERYASGFSGISLERYFEGWEKTCGFSATTLDVTRFLIANRRAFKDLAQTGINPPEQVKAFAQLCGDVQRLRALFVFTYADRVQWESEDTDAARWWLSRELYSKTHRLFQPSASIDPSDNLRAAGFGEEELRVLRDFGHDFFSGLYQRHAPRLGSHLLHIASKGKTASPKATILRDGTSTLLAVAAHDWPGLAACISGTLSEQGIELRQAHLFSAKNQGLALDFFHLQADAASLAPDLTKTIERAILNQHHITPADESALPHLQGSFTLTERAPGKYALKFESAQDVRGTVYALCYKVFRHLGGDIHGLTAYSTTRHAFVTVHHNLPRGLKFGDAQRIVRGW